MIDIEKLKEIKKLIGEEISTNLNLVENKEFSIICEISGKLNLIIDRLENPNKWVNIDRELNRI